MKNGSLNALVTGGGGFLGSVIARMLAQRGDRVTSLSRRAHPHLAAHGVHQIQGDIADAQAVQGACQGRDVVFHAAAKAGIWGDYNDFYRTNVRGTQNIIAACRKAKIQRLIYTSSPSVVFDGSDMEGVDERVDYPKHYHAHYPATKALAEQAVRKAGTGALKTIALRPHLIWGPGDNHLVPRIIKRGRRLRQVGAGDNLVDCVYVDNAAQAHLLAADGLAADPGLSGKVYFISQGAPVPLWEMVNAILKAGGKPPVTGRMSRKTALRLGTACEQIYRWLRLSGEPPMTRFLAMELSSSHWFDIQAARDDLGYVPGISTEEGLKRLAKWLNPTA